MARKKIENLNKLFTIPCGWRRLWFMIFDKCRGTQLDSKSVAAFRSDEGKFAWQSINALPFDNCIIWNPKFPFLPSNSIRTRMDIASLSDTFTFAWALPLRPLLCTQKKEISRKSPFCTRNIDWECRFLFFVLFNYSYMAAEAPLARLWSARPSFFFWEWGSQREIKLLRCGFSLHRNLTKWCFDGIFYIRSQSRELFLANFSLYTSDSESSSWALTLWPSGKTFARQTEQTLDMCDHEIWYATKGHEAE